MYIYKTRSDNNAIENEIINCFWNKISATISSINERNQIVTNIIIYWIATTQIIELFTLKN